MKNLKKSKPLFDQGDFTLLYCNIDHALYRIARVIREHQHNYYSGVMYVVDVHGKEDVLCEQSMRRATIEEIELQISFLKSLIEENEYCLRKLKEKANAGDLPR